MARPRPPTNGAFRATPPAQAPPRNGQLPAPPPGPAQIAPPREVSAAPHACAQDTRKLLLPGRAGLEDPLRAPGAAQAPPTPRHQPMPSRPVSGCQATERGGGERPPCSRPRPHFGSASGEARAGSGSTAVWAGWRGGRCALWLRGGGGDGAADAGQPRAPPGRLDVSLQVSGKARGAADLPSPRRPPDSSVPAGPVCGGVAGERADQAGGRHVQPLPEASVQQGQDLPSQAQVRAGHPAVRAAQEGTSVAERRAGPEAGRAAAPRRGAQRLGGRARGGLLQPHQPHLRHHRRRVHGAVVPGHVGWPQVRVPLAGRAPVPQAHGAVGPPLHGPAHGLGRGADQRRGALPHPRRHAVPQELPAGGEEDPVAAVPRVRARLHPPLRPHRAAGLRGARQHVLQALLLLRARVRPHRHQGAGAAERNDRADVPLSPWALQSPRQCQGTLALTATSPDHGLVLCRKRTQ